MPSLLRAAPLFDSKKGPRWMWKTSFLPWIKHISSNPVRAFNAGLIFCVVGISWTSREPRNSNATPRSMSAELSVTLLKANSAGGPWDVETFWSDHLYFIPLITLEWRVWEVSETIAMPLPRCNGVTCLWSNMCHCAVLRVKAFFLSSLSIINFSC